MFSFTFASYLPHTRTRSKVHFPSTDLAKTYSERNHELRCCWPRQLWNCSRKPSYRWVQRGA